VSQSPPARRSLGIGGGSSHRFDAPVFHRKPGCHVTVLYRNSFGVPNHAVHGVGSSASAFDSGHPDNFTREFCTPSHPACKSQGWSTPPEISFNVLQRRRCTAFSFIFRLPSRFATFQRTTASLALSRCPVYHRRLMAASSSLFDSCQSLARSIAASRLARYLARSYSDTQSLHFRARPSLVRLPTCCPSPIRVLPSSAQPTSSDGQTSRARIPIKPVNAGDAVRWLDEEKVGLTSAPHLAVRLFVVDRINEQ
jgi:hypothetical protein